MILAKYSEIILKSSYVRKHMSHMLQNAIRATVSAKSIIDVSGILEVDAPHSAADRLRYIPGISKVIVASKIPRDIESIAAECLTRAKGFKGSFALRVKGSGTTRVAVEVGELVRTRYGLKVDLEQPDHEIFIDLRENCAYIYDTIVEGIGGLPIGSQETIAFISFTGMLHPAVMMMARGLALKVIMPKKHGYDEKKFLEALGIFHIGKKLEQETIEENDNEELLSLAVAKYKIAACDLNEPGLLQKHSSILFPMVGFTSEELNENEREFLTKFFSSQGFYIFLLYLCFLPGVFL
ncbi:hypothetical protein COT30_04635 [Candidatus Micrarchaeota archaeon CG08_land_8_20_14_0_20_49_17]|nr:MAG: hypothetical protein AUJ13_05610 [Candidatus Micrarchaeota archaeon CG1_02_49_24]PIU09388.1 MAG: hypothetical protein COT30_04635 [Candidatus Micrarchaeota archaeon CG08_land_8_20_14_0_20_49_17]HII53857.1 hypothetical protein [Candidatus Micrarchaeota archaeon]